MARIVELTESEMARGVEIHQIDCVSLYPSRMFSCDFPGKMHPVILNPSDLPRNGEMLSLDEIKRYFGLFSVFVMPASDSPIPSLPYRALSKRVYYALCKSCAEQADLDGVAPSSCSHLREEERGFWGCFNSVDLETAMERCGVKCLRVAQVYDYGRAEINNQIFSSMIKVSLFPK